jgi:hypothetical protein
VEKIFLLASSLLMIATFFLVGCTSGGNEKTTAGGNQKIAVMNPAITNTMVDRVPLTNRLDSLEDKTIYMVDINWGGPEAGYSVFEEMQVWFSENMPSVKTVLKRKRGPYEAGDPELWKEISEKGDAAIVGISG